MTQRSDSFGNAAVAALCAAIVWASPASPDLASAQERPRIVVDNIQVPTMRRMVQSRITRGAPYSAETLTESVQVLGDGNRIVRKTMTRVFRDAEGRVRTEQVAESGEVETINISDPVGGHSYALYPKTKKAVRTGVIVATPGGTAGANFSRGGRGTPTTSTSADGKVTIAAREGQAGSGGGATGAAGGRGGGGGGRGGAAVGRGGRGGFGGTVGKVTQEDLGQQVIEGVLANGTRRTTVIEAGSIGNEQAIQIVSEEWFSPDLQLLVLTKHLDPRVGNTIFKVSSIVRAEPARTLFEVPGDYTIEQPYNLIRREQK